MKKSMRLLSSAVVAGMIMAVATPCYAVSTNGNGTTNSTSQSGSSSGSQGESATSTQTQTQTQNAGTSSQIQTQTQASVEAQIESSKPEYTPANANALAHRSVVANAVQELIRTAAQISNTGIGTQIRTIAQTQNQNQDKIGQAIDKADERGAAAKFFIGANYKELKEAKQIMEQNQAQIRELTQLMEQVTSEGDKLQIASQIISLQNVQLELRDQISEMSGGFSLFGWINRWYNHFSL